MNRHAISCHILLAWEWAKKNEKLSMIFLVVLIKISNYNQESRMTTKNRKPHIKSQGNCEMRSKVQINSSRNLQSRLLNDVGDQKWKSNKFKTDKNIKKMSTIESTKLCMYAMNKWVASRNAGRLGWDQDWQLDQSNTSRLINDTCFMLVDLNSLLSNFLQNPFHFCFSTHNQTGVC